jgi:hypothetical protein
MIRFFRRLLPEIALAERLPEIVIAESNMDWKPE